MVLRFIEDDPALSTYGRLHDIRAREFNLDEARRRSEEQQGVDTATRVGIRNVLARPSPVAEQVTQPGAAPGTAETSAGQASPATVGIEPPDEAPTIEQPTAGAGITPFGGQTGLGQIPPSQPPSPQRVAAENARADLQKQDLKPLTPPPSAQPGPSQGVAAPGRQPAPPGPVGGTKPLDLTNPLVLQPIIERLSQVPGGGQAAAQMLVGARDRALAERQRVDQLESNAMVALAAGDPQMFQFWANKAGMQLPPQLMQNAQIAGLFAKGSLIANRYYQHDPDQAMRFASSYAQTGGNLDQAYALAGAPRSKPDLMVAQVRQGEQIVSMLIDRAKLAKGLPYQEAATEIGRGPATGVGRAAGATPTYNAAVLLATRRAQEAGRQPTSADIEQAHRFLNAAKQSPLERAKLIQKHLEQMTDANPRASRDPTQFEAMKRQAARDVDDWLNGGAEPNIGGRPTLSPQDFTTGSPTFGGGGAGGDVAEPQSDDDYNALPSGTVFRDPDDGQLYRKP